VSGGDEERWRRWGEERGGNGEKGAGCRCRGFKREGNGEARRGRSVRVGVGFLAFCKGGGGRKAGQIQYILR
jgi:hypothetical protein